MREICGMALVELPACGWVWVREDKGRICGLAQHSTDNEPSQLIQQLMKTYLNTQNTDGLSESPFSARDFKFSSFLSSFLSFFFFFLTFLDVHILCAWYLGSSQDDIVSPGTGVINYLGPTYGCWNQTQVLCESNKRSCLLSHLTSHCTFCCQ